MDEFETSSKILDDGGNDIKFYSEHELSDGERKSLEEERDAQVIKGPILEARIVAEQENYFEKPLEKYLYILRKNI